MHRKVHYAIALFLLFSEVGFGQTISTVLPAAIKDNGKYLFYLHGGVVTVLGNNAINQSVPEWGPYEYLKILDSLWVRGFNVISENRKEGVDDSVYVNKIILQIDTLIQAGVQPGRILLLGASAGCNIVLHASSKLRNRELKYVLMGGCWKDTHKGYESIELYGHFLSIIEVSDPHGTCKSIFENRNTLSGWKEVVLHTGLSHGFFYKGRKEWLDPVIDWFNHSD